MRTFTKQARRYLADNPGVWDLIRSEVPLQAEAEAVADSTGSSPHAGAQDQPMEAAAGAANAMAMPEQESGGAAEAAPPTENATGTPEQESSEAGEAAAPRENAMATPERESSEAAEAAAPMENTMATPGDVLEAPSMAAPELRAPLCEEASGLLAPTQPKFPSEVPISTSQTSTPISSQAEGEPAVPKKAMAKVSLELKPSIFGKNVLSKVSLSPSGSESIVSDEGILSPPPSPTAPPSAEPSQPSKLRSQAASTPGTRAKAAPKAPPRAASVARQVYSQVVAGFGGAVFCWVSCRNSKFRYCMWMNQQRASKAKNVKCKV